MYDEFLTECARKTMRSATSNANQCRSNYVGTLHILSALDDCEDCSVVKTVVSKLQKKDSLPFQEAIYVVARIRQHHDPNFHPVLGHAAAKVSELAVAEAQAMNCHLADNEHILLALAKNAASASSVFLSKCGLSYAAIRDSVRDITCKNRLKITRDGQNVRIAIGENVLDMTPEELRAVISKVMEIANSDN